LGLVPGQELGQQRAQLVPFGRIEAGRQLVLDRVGVGLELVQVVTAGADAVLDRLRR
jgi:hypothetical protein